MICNRSPSTFFLKMELFFKAYTIVASIYAIYVLITSRAYLSQIHVVVAMLTIIVSNVIVHLVWGT